MYYNLFHERNKIVSLGRRIAPQRARAHPGRDGHHLGERIQPTGEEEPSPKSNRQGDEEATENYEKQARKFGFNIESVE